MPHQLANGYTVRCVSGSHFYNGHPIRILQDDVERVVIVTDPGNLQGLADRVAEAVEDCIASVAIMRREAEGPGCIEILYDLFTRGAHHPKSPLIPETDQSRLPFAAPCLPPA